MREQNVLTLALVTGLLAASTPAISSECCPADFTGDGHVNIDEVLGIIAGWGDCPDLPEPCPMDIDESGRCVLRGHGSSNWQFSIESLCNNRSLIQF